MGSETVFVQIDFDNTGEGSNEIRRPNIPTLASLSKAIINAKNQKITDNDLEILQYYMKKEKEMVILRYIHTQPELSIKKRAVLIDWLIDVQNFFMLTQDTLFLAVKIIDRYLMKRKVLEKQFQLLGGTAFFIAAKFYERKPPLINELVYISDGAYNIDEVIMMEIQILQALNFSLCTSLSCQFLRFYVKCTGKSNKALKLAQFILEKSLLDYEIIEQEDSKIAAASLLLALKIKKNGTGWNERAIFCSGYGEEELRPMMYRLNMLISYPLYTNLKAIDIKYSHSSKYKAVLNALLNDEQKIEK